jgi:hypothetical protein
MGVQMLVSDYLDQVIKSRPYKYSTKQSLIRDIKRLGIADLDTYSICDFQRQYFSIYFFKTYL